MKLHTTANYDMIPEATKPELKALEKAARILTPLCNTQGSWTEDATAARIALLGLVKFLSPIVPEKKIASEKK